jgi:hypothetical protein
MEFIMPLRLKMKQLLKEILPDKNKGLFILFLSFFVLMTVFITTGNADVNKWIPQNSGMYNSEPSIPPLPIFTEINVSGAKGNNDWYIDLPLISFSVTRTNLTTYYTWDYNFENTEWIVYKEPLVALEGKHTLYYYSKDQLETEDPYKFKEIKVDSMPPVITKIESADNSGTINFKPVISADYSDAVSGIDTTTAKIYLDEIDKTLEAVITETSISYTPSTDLSEGLHAVKVIVKDRAGNQAEANWSFKVLAQFTIQLYKGWNLIALPINPPTPFTAQTLLDLINSQGGNATQIVRWDPITQSWIIHINNLPINDFKIKPDEGYFIKTGKTSELVP